ncbi:MAG: hypothetical protein EOP82_04305 [Variovorax sp.]|nr:MAG: hypothetical protein EOP82_04305 [Variovorax sp.]
MKNQTAITSNSEIERPRLSDALKFNRPQADKNDVKRAAFVKTKGTRKLNIRAEIEARRSANIKGQPKRLRFAASKLRQALEKIKTRLPGGVPMDDRGNLAGQQIIVNIPVYEEGQLAHWAPHAGKPFASALNELRIETLRIAKATIGGLKVANMATRDFYRFDYEIPVSGGTFRSMELLTTVEAERNLEVAKALQTFTGNANATFVLSSILTQRI